ncbi:hypothetical protein IU402_08265 [Aerococcaceae bacterium zg-BR9]|uniref:hypothetical protein n=1 Tax=Aerococcaceae bacterium zg-1292 TaxID=2774330 RepID=UPI0040644A6B|nr:hypothetical protein [Aerococcaceae bacterium zg-BR9]
MKNKDVLISFRIKKEEEEQLNKLLLLEKIDNKSELIKSIVQEELELRQSFLSDILDYYEVINQRNKQLKKQFYENEMHTSINN